MIKLLLLLISFILFSNCGDVSFSKGATDTGNYITFPKPIGDWIIPLDQQPYFTFNYVEMDSNGHQMPPFPKLLLMIKEQSKGIYTYDFENNGDGLLLIFKDTPRDSSGIYIIGEFRNFTENIYGDTLLWLPQFPENKGVWEFGTNRYMEYIKYDTSYSTSGILHTEWLSMDNEASFQAHPSFLLKETYHDTLTYYYFRKGLGLLGFERIVNNKTRAVGTLKSLNRIAHGY